MEDPLLYFLSASPCLCCLLTVAPLCFSLPDSIKEPDIQTLTRWCFDEIQHHFSVSQLSVAKVIFLPQHLTSFAHGAQQIQFEIIVPNSQKSNYMSLHPSPTTQNHPVPSNLYLILWKFALVCHRWTEFRCWSVTSHGSQIIQCVETRNTALFGKLGPAKMAS